MAVNKIKKWFEDRFWHFLGTVQEPFYSWLNAMANAVVLFRNPERKICCGTLNPDKTFYVIGNFSKGVGIAGWHDKVLGCLLWAKRKGYIPVVAPSPAREGDGDWFAFFKQVSPYTLEEVLKSKNVVHAIERGMIHKRYNKRNIRRRHEMSKSVSLSDEAKRFIDERMSGLFDGMPSPVVAVRYRGTDYRTAIGHAKVPDVQDFCDEVEKDLRKWGVPAGDGERIFVVTEEQEALDAIRLRFPKCRYVVKERFSNFKQGACLCFLRLPATTPIENNFLYLLDIYAMARCDYLIGGINGSVLMALNLNGNRYRGVHVMNTGVN